MNGPHLLGPVQRCSRLQRVGTWTRAKSTCDPSCSSSGFEVVGLMLQLVAVKVKGYMTVSWHLESYQGLFWSASQFDVWIVLGVTCGACRLWDLPGAT